MNKVNNMEDWVNIVLEFNNVNYMYCLNIELV